MRRHHVYVTYELYMKYPATRTCSRDSGRGNLGLSAVQWKLEKYQGPMA